MRTQYRFSRYDGPRLTELIKKLGDCLSTASDTPLDGIKSFLLMDTTAEHIEHAIKHDRPVIVGCANEDKRKELAKLIQYHRGTQFLLTHAVAVGTFPPENSLEKLRSTLESIRDLKMKDALQNPRSAYKSVRRSDTIYSTMNELKEDQNLDCDAIYFDEFCRDVNRLAFEPVPLLESEEERQAVIASRYNTFAKLSTSTMPSHRPRGRLLKNMISPNGRLWTDLLLHRGRSSKALRIGMKLRRKLRRRRRWKRLRGTVSYLKKRLTRSSRESERVCRRRTLMIRKRQIRILTRPPGFVLFLVIHP